ncbi:hypothetical protein Tco_0312661 [Tanacetum coccineum]
MVEYSQKGHNGISRTRSTGTFNALATTQVQLNNLGIEIKKVNAKEIGFGSLPSFTEANLRDHVKLILTTIEADSNPIRHIGSPQYAVSTPQNRRLLFRAYSYGASHIDNSIPRKEKDPGSFTLPYYINNVFFDNALSDLGASISVMPLSTYPNLDLGELAHTKLIVELANRAVKYPKGIAENVLVDYMVIYDKNSFSKIIYVSDLKTDSENDNDEVNMPSFSSPEPTVSYFDDLDNFKDFEKEFPVIVYNDALMSKLDFLNEPTISPQHIDEFNLKESLSEYDEEEQNVLYFNDLFPFNVIYLNDSKSDKDNDNDKIDIKQSSGDNVMNTNDGAYAHGSNKLLKTSHEYDTSNKFFKTENFIKKLNVNIVAWNYLNNGMLLNLIKNLYVSFGIPFDPKLFYKDGIKLGQV